jgi:malate synthase
MMIAGGYTVDKTLHAAVTEILVGSEVEASAFWSELGAILDEFSPRCTALLAERDDLQAKMDAWNTAAASKAADGSLDADSTRLFLESIGYIAPEGTGADSACVGLGEQAFDAEISSMPGPQLVCPVDNARYALNACNARWGSLRDALYGTNMLGDAPARGAYDEARGAAVLSELAVKLDAWAPLDGASWADAGTPTASGEGDGFTFALVGEDGEAHGLADAAAFVGFADGGRFVFAHNELRFVVEVDAAAEKRTACGVVDVVLEAAITTIQDCEDSVAAVDGADKAAVYSNWANLMRGTLTTSFAKGGETVTRSLNGDVAYTRAGDGAAATMAGRSLMLIRNVGHHMTNPMVLNERGEACYEGIVDALVTALGAKHDVLKSEDAAIRNSRCGSIYIVKPKMHGPSEVAFTLDLFARVEGALGLAPGAIKLGIMDEERRTTVNLEACIALAKERCCFINTGFLDRTGDEIHTSMRLGPMLTKGMIKGAQWRTAYEKWNVLLGLKGGLQGQAQIGKGMWDQPANLKGMYDTKAASSTLTGATTAWVPSPTAATLHALHYHESSVAAQQAELVAGLGDVACVAFVLCLAARRSPRVLARAGDRRCCARSDAIPACCSSANKRVPRPPPPPTANLIHAHRLPAHPQHPGDASRHRYAPR